ncbi:MAG: YqaJ viral recombinase family protein, partial [Actinomycetia bacterium]|nr:YqaJ viral recombinase family protein [Actinomycetes bacterium]
MTDTDQTAWLEWRRHGIGASDVAATKANIYGGATKAVATKLGHDTNDITPELAARGKRWEPVIAAGIHAHTGYHIAGAQTQLEHPTHPIYRCTPDGFLLTTPSGRISDAAGGCEIKTKGPSAPWQWTYWHAQCQWSMLVAQLPRW